MGHVFEAIQVIGRLRAEGARPFHALHTLPDLLQAALKGVL